MAGLEWEGGKGCYGGGKLRYTQHFNFETQMSRAVYRIKSIL